MFRGDHVSHHDRNSLDRPSIRSLTVSGSPPEPPPRRTKTDKRSRRDQSRNFPEVTFNRGWRGPTGRPRVTWNPRGSTSPVFHGNHTPRVSYSTYVGGPPPTSPPLLLTWTPVHFGGEGATSSVTREGCRGGEEDRDLGPQTLSGRPVDP